MDAGGAFFDNCEFTNITVDYSDYCCDGYGGAIRISSNYGVVYLNRSKLTNITVKRESNGGLRGGAIHMGGSILNDVTLVNTVIADNLLSHTGESGGNNVQGGAIMMHGGDLQLINSTDVNNQISITDNSYYGGGSAIWAGDNQNDGDGPHITIFNSIDHSNTIEINAGS